MSRSHRSSRHRIFLVLCVIYALSGAACGEEDANESPRGVTPPEESQRELPARGGDPGEQAIEEPEVDPFPEEGEEYDLGLPEASECCAVLFSLPDPYEDGDADWVRLKGTLPPLLHGEGTELTLESGSWSASVCMPPAYVGVYFFEVARDIKDIDGQPFFYVERWANEIATPIVETAEGIANTWYPADTCENLDVGIHAGMTSGG